MHIPAEIRPKLLWLLLAILILAGIGFWCRHNGVQGAAHLAWLYVGTGLHIAALFFAVVGFIVLGALRKK